MQKIFQNCEASERVGTSELLKIHQEGNILIVEFPEGTLDLGIPGHGWDMPLYCVPVPNQKYRLDTKAYFTVVEGLFRGVSPIDLWESSEYLNLIEWLIERGAWVENKPRFALWSRVGIPHFEDEQQGSIS